MTIICPVHGAFQQVASDHLHGCGCGKCTKSRGHLKRNHAAEEVKREHTLMQRYGVAHALQSEAFKNKAKDTWRAHYNVDHPMKTDKVKQQVCNTMLERYGVKYAYQSEELLERFHDTLKQNYGVRWPLASSEIREKGIDTLIKRYGVPNSMMSQVVKDKVIATTMERYGVTNAMQFSEIQRKSLETRIANGSFVKSKVECRLTELLQNVFGTGMIKTQYVDDVRYPHACDFYLPVRDMFIELNAAWTHGHGWYDANNIDCQQKLSTWQAKAKTSKYYQNAIETWTGYDVRKRQDARIHDLNYVVFWDNDLADAKAWIEAGCPDRKDWQ